MAGDRGRRRNKYTLVHIKILIAAARRGKITFKKIFNWLSCCTAYLLQRKKSARSPFMVSIELWNECNIQCVFCRSEKGEIYDIKPKSSGEPIGKGRMPFEMARDIIEQVKDYALIAVLYTNGEPLMYKELPELVSFATEKKMASMISSNGLLLDEKKAKALLDAGLDFIKIQLSGFTQDIYGIQIRNGNVEKLKENIKRFALMNKEGNYGAVILVDYILYNYNRHQFPLVKDFCDRLPNVMINTRPGNPSHGLEDMEPPLSTEPLPLKISCDWLWKSMQINWNGDILQCCEGVVWSDPQVYEKYAVGTTRLLDVWNGEKAVAMREAMSTKGRGAIPMCSKCLRKGVSFKW